MLERNVEMVGRFERHTLPDESVVYYEPDPVHAYYGEVKENKRANGGYSFVRDSRYIGVSTPCKAIDPDPTGLMWWAAKVDQLGIAELARECLDSGESLAWLRTQRSIDEKLRERELTWDKVRDKAADRGTAIHERIFLALAQDKRPPSLSRLSAEERAYGQAAIRWWRKRKPKPLYAEQVTVCHELNVAGRFDLLCEIDGERVLVDAKTREKGTDRRSDHAQLEGYELCNRSCGIGPSDRRLTLVLCPDGKPLERWSVGSEQDFLLALMTYRAGSDLGKRMTKAAKGELSEALTGADLLKALRSFASQPDEEVLANA